MALIRSDRRYLLILLLQAPFLGGVLWLMFSKDRRLSADHGPEALFLVLCIVIGMTWFGVLNAIREIVKELPIYRRERSVGLSVSAYLGSKVAVLGGFTILQSIMLVVIGLAPQTVHTYQRTAEGEFALKPGGLLDLEDVIPATGSFISNPKAELIIGIALTGLSAMALGLLISAIAKNADKAVTVVPILIVPQLLLAGGFFPVNAPILSQAKYFASAQWGMSAAASTVDMNAVRFPISFIGVVVANPEQAQRAFAGEPEARRKFESEVERSQTPSWNHDSSTWSANAFMLMLLTAAGIVGAYFVLRRGDIQALAANPTRAGPLAQLTKRLRTGN